jgi:hypothetical protein
MRKHTRKHKVMKSKMTKSKSKKVMQKGGFGQKVMNKFYKQQKQDTRKSLDKVRGLRLTKRRREYYETKRQKHVTDGIKKMQNNGH